MTKYVKIPVEEYLRLKTHAKILLNLTHAGVDNWEGYDFAYELYEDNGGDITEDNITIPIIEE